MFPCSSRNRWTVGGGKRRFVEGAPKSLSAVLDRAEAGTPPTFDLPTRATIRTVSTQERQESPTSRVYCAGGFTTPE